MFDGIVTTLTPFATSLGFTYMGFMAVVLGYRAYCTVNLYLYDRRAPQRAAEERARIDAFFAREAAKRNDPRYYLPTL